MPSAAAPPHEAEDEIFIEVELLRDKLTGAIRADNEAQALFRRFLPGESPRGNLPRDPDGVRLSATLLRLRATLGNKDWSRICELYQLGFFGVTDCLSEWR